MGVFGAEELAGRPSRKVPSLFNLHILIPYRQDGQRY